MHESQISDVVLAVLVNDHELTLPELLIIGDLIVVGLSLSDLEDFSVSVESDLHTFELLGVDAFELHHQFFVGQRLGLNTDLHSLHYTGHIQVLAWHVLQGKLTQHGVTLEVLELGIFIEGVKLGGGGVEVVGSFEFSLVELDLMLEHGVTSLVQSIGKQIVNDLRHQLSIFLDGNHLVVLLHNLHEIRVLLLPVTLYLVHLAHLSDSLEELISGTSLLWLEEREPEDLGHGVGEGLADILRQVIVNDVLEVHVIEFVGPGVEDLEALVVHLLTPESEDVFLDKLEVSLVSLDGVAQVVLKNLFLVVPKVRSDGSDARGTLKILGVEQFLNILF